MVAGVTTHLAEVKGPVMDRLSRSDFVRHLRRLYPGVNVIEGDAFDLKVFHGDLLEVGPVGLDLLREMMLH